LTGAPSQGLAAAMAPFDDDDDDDDGDETSPSTPPF
jgi:hypothetical protein